MSFRRASRRPSGMTPASSAFCRISRLTVCRNAAPGNGTWSRAHWLMAKNPSTNSSFQRFSKKLTRWTTRSAGLSVWNPSSSARAGTRPVWSMTSLASRRPSANMLLMNPISR